MPDSETHQHSILEKRARKMSVQTTKRTYANPALKEFVTITEEVKNRQTLNLYRILH